MTSSHKLDRMIDEENDEDVDGADSSQQDNQRPSQLSERSSGTKNRDLNPMELQGIELSQE